MKITSTEKKVTLNINNEENTFPLNYLGYQKITDGITFLRGKQSFFTANIAQITVNGEQAITENIDKLLDPLFKLSNAGGSIDQVQSDYLEKNTSSASYIKNKPYTELNISQSLPTTANAGDIAVFKDSDGKNLSVWKYDGFIWIQDGADYNLIFKASTNQKQVLNGYSYQKEVATMYYAKMLEGSSRNSIYATRIDKINSDYAFQQIQLTIEDNNADVELSNIETDSIAITTNQNINTQGEIPNKISLSNIKSGYIQSSFASKEFQGTNFEPITNGQQMMINIHNDKITLNNIIRPNFCTLSPQERNIGEIAEKDFVVNITDFKGLMTKNTETESFLGSSLDISNNYGITVHGKLSFHGDIERIFLNNFGTNSQNSDLDLDITLVNPSILTSLTIYSCKIVYPAKFDAFFDALIADGTLRNDKLVPPDIHLGHVDNYTLSDERKVALEHLGFTVNID